MAILTLRLSKGSPLTNLEVDNNFSNINNEVGVLSNLTTTAKGNLVSAINEIASESTSNVTITGGTIANVLVSNVTISNSTWNGNAIPYTLISGLTTANVTEVTNLYFTNTRARTSISVSGAGSYDNATGIITITGGVTSVAGANGAVSNAQIVAGFSTQIVPGTTGNVLTSDGTNWTSTAPGSSGATLSDDTSTNYDYLVGMANASTGAWTTAYVSTGKLYFNPSTGTLNATVFNSLSDVALKDSINPVNGAVDILKNIKGIEFNWLDNGKKSAGVIAQDVEKILPHLVSTSNEGLKSVNYSGLIAYLIQAVNELTEKIKVLESK